MQRVKSLMEWYLGIEPAGSGEAARWELTWGGGELSAAWLAFVLFAAVALIGVLSWKAGGEGTARRLRMLGLRWCAVTIVAMWLGAVTLTVVRTGLPTLVLMIDTSASMGLEDYYSKPARAAGGRASHGARLPIAKQWLLQSDAALIRELARRYRLHVYEFSAEARRIGHTATAEDLTATVQAIAGLAPSGEATRPGPCLDEVLSEFRGTAPAAAVVISDGIASLGPGEKLSSAQQPLTLGVPLYTVPMGSDEAVLDLEIYDLQVDPIVFIGDTIAIDVTARGWGLEGRQATFELQHAGQAAPLDRTSITVPDGDQSLPVRLSFTPEYEGDQELIVTAEPFPEELNRENNVLRRRVQVRQGRLKVLFMERAPRWEYRHLKALLERDANIELRTVLQESDLAYQQEDRTALAGFPATRESLFEYDVLILGDIDLQYLNPGALDLVRDFVGTRGGGLILIAGERHNPSAFAGTPLAPLIPVNLEAVQDSASSPFHLVPAQSGLDHPLLRIGDESRADAFWQQLPPLHWSVDARVREPGGVAVATRGAADDRRAVIALQRYGGGQVLFHATDELWRWRKRVEDRYYGRYWRQAVRFVCRAERLGQSGQVVLTTDRATYRQGESVRFRLQLFDPGLWESDHEAPTLILERDAGSPQTIVLAETLPGSSEFTGVLPSPVAGDYLARQSAPLSDGIPAECRFSVELPHRELQRRVAEIRDLQQAARATNGVALKYDEVPSLPTLVPRGEITAVLSSQSIAIWARGEWLLLFVGLLAAEWLLRRGG